MSYQFIQTSLELKLYIESIRSAKWIALDTEFVTEGNKSRLCLVQIASSSGLALIDATLVTDLSPFWERVCDKKTTLIVHAARGDMEFCFRSIGRFPQKLFDIQLASGFVSTEFPSSYKNIVKKYLNVNLSKNETRTNWKRRPLSQLQIEYALDDVRYLEPLASLLKKKMKELNRYSWFKEETKRSLQLLEDACLEDHWRQIKGVRNCSRRELAIVRGVWNWRQRIAAFWKKTPSKILRNDLILEIAKRKSADIERVISIQGIREYLKNDALVMLCEVIRDALLLEENDLPELKDVQQTSSATCNILTHFIMTALNQIANQENIAITILATHQDIRAAVLTRINHLSPDDLLSKLDHGWRVKFFGPLIDELIAGKIALRIAEEGSKQPLQWLKIKKEELEN
ncbi:MAG: hypothetical protein Q4C95_05275 [Planctomycetia bacterium]|nr:hypothetical protein [Planctomycetia bacterium]